MANNTIGNKRRRIDNTVRRLLHVGGVSTSGLAKILSELRSCEPLEEPVSRYTLRTANEAAFLELRCIVDLPLKTGGTIVWEFVDPTALLQRAVDTCPKLQALFAKAVHDRRPTMSQPWKIIIGFDEFTPGDGSERVCSEGL